jgi:hypothetical protein
MCSHGLMTVWHVERNDIWNIKKNGDETSDMVFN